MKPLLALLCLAATSAALVGCDPAPSTTLAPDKPAPDTSKLSPEEMDKLVKEKSSGDRQ